MLKSDKKEIESALHTLYSERVDEEKITLNENEEIYKIIPKHKRYRVYIGKFSEKNKGLHPIFDELKKAQQGDSLELVINSPGGALQEGMLFYNIIQQKFYNKVTTFLDNYGFSMGALLFCMGNKRVIYPYSQLMFHTYSHGANGKGNSVKARLKYSRKIIESFLEELIVEKGFLTKKEYQDMLIGKDFWMDAKELCKRKIATHVIANGKEMTAKEYLKELKNQKKLKKAKKKKKKKK